MVIDPESAHRVVRGRVDAHRHVIGVLARDALVDLEEVAVLVPDVVQPQPPDGVGEVEVDAAPAGPHVAPPLIADVLGVA